MVSCYSSKTHPSPLDINVRNPAHDHKAAKDQDQTKAKYQPATGNDAGKYPRLILDEKLVDKAYFFIAPKIIGGKEALTSVGAQGILNLARTPYLKEVKIERIGKDILISGYPTYKK